jgi:hypothetical protein
MSKEKVADAEANQPISAASRMQTGTNGETVITLDAKTQRLIGLQTATLAAAALPPEMKAWGRVLDSATLISAHNSVVAAQAALQASQPEYQRLKELSGQDNASLRALETAEAQMQQDQSALATAQAQLVAASSPAMAGEPPHFFQSLAKQESVLVRLDLPADELVAEAPTGAQLKISGQNSEVRGQFVGLAAATDPQVQGAGFIFVVTNAPAELTPGLAVTGFLQLPGEQLHGVVVPDAAAVRSDERAWIYAQTGETNFVRREIKLNHPTASGWFVTNSVVPGDKVVVTGAQTLLSEDRKSQIKIED